MPLMTWDPNFSVGVDLIDKQHKMLISMANDLYDAMQSRQENAVLKKLLNRLSL